MAATQDKPRRSCFGTLFKSTLGCLAFFAGGLLVLVLFLPRVAARFAPGLIEDGFEQNYRGRLEVERVELAWKARQSVQGIVLRDPDGHEVARARVALPSLLDLLGDATRRVDVELEAELVAGDDGVTNLERALEPRSAPKAGASSGGGNGKDALRSLGELDVELAVVGRRVTWSDARTRALGARVEVRNLKLDAAARPGQALRAHAAAEIEGETPGKLELDVSAAGPLRPDATWPFGRVDARLEGRALPFAMVDGLAGQRGRLVEALGTTIDVDLALSGFDGASGEVAARLHSDKAEIEVAGTFADGVLSCAPDQVLRVSLQPPFALLSALATEHVSADTELLHGEPRGPWSLEVMGLVLPIVPRDGEPTQDFARRALAGARGALTFEAADRFDVQNDLSRELGLILGVEGVSVNATAQADEPLKAQIYCSVDTGLPERGDVQLDLSTAPALAFGGGFPFSAFDLQVRNLASAALDALLGGEGCASELLGDAFGLRLGFTSEGDVIALVRAVQGVALTLQGHVADGVLGIHDGGGLTTILRLPPGWFERCVVRRFDLPAELSFLPEEERPLRVHTKTLSVAVDGLWEDRRDPAALARRVTSELELDLGSWRWFAAGDDGAHLSAVATRGTLRLDPGEPLTLAIVGELEGEGGRGPYEIDVELPDPARVLAGGGLERVRARLRASDAALAEVAGVAGLDDLAPDALRDVLGEGFELVLDAGLPTAGAGRIDLRGGSSTLEIEGALALEGKGLRVQGDEGLRVSWRPSADALARLVAARLPAQSRLEPVGDGPFRIELSALHVVPPPDTVPEADRTAALVAGLGLELALATPDLVWRDAPDAAPLSIAGLSARARVDPDAPAELELTADVVATPPGRIALSARTLEPTGTLVDASALRGVRVAFELEARELPTAVLDALAHQAGLLVDLFGPRVELAASSDGVSFDEGAFTASATSARGAVSWQGRVADGVLTSAAGEGLEARLPLSPLVSERIVGPLVPLAVHLSKPEGAAPVVLSAHDVAFALDGDLTRLDATIVLELGDVVYELLPGIDAGFLRDVSKERLRHVPPITIRIVQGVASYDELPIRIGEHSVPFVGRFGLVDHALHFDASVPLAALGKGLTQKLGQAERFVKPDTVIPVELRGTLTRPKLGLGDDFVEGLLEGAGRSLLEDLLKPKKKD